MYQLYPYVTRPWHIYLAHILVVMVVGERLWTLKSSHGHMEFEFE